MALVSLASLLTKKADPTQIMCYAKSTALVGGTHWNSSWATAGNFPVGAIPGAAAIPTSATAGSLGQLNKAGAEQRAWLRRFNVSGVVGGVAASIALVDRLAHMGGLDGTLTTAQTVSTPALTRFTAGADMAAVEIYTTIGTTATTYTCSYTNQAGTAARTSIAASIGTTSFNAARSVLPIPLASGDTMVKSVETITLAASTGTAGNFGVTLYKILGVWPVNSTFVYPHTGAPEFGYPMPAIPDNACLDLIAFGSGQSNVAVMADLVFFED